MRFGGKAPRQRSILLGGMKAMVQRGLSYLGSWPAICSKAVAEALFPGLLRRPMVHTAARSATPSGNSPVVTNRQSAISSLRASATIIVLRFLLAFSVRALYQRASALFF